MQTWNPLMPPTCLYRVTGLRSRNLHSTRNSYIDDRLAGLLGEEVGATVAQYTVGAMLHSVL